jgi:hypothetical protein
MDRKKARAYNIIPYERIYQFATYSYVRSHLGNDSCLPIYKTNPAICDTSLIPVLAVTFFFLNLAIISTRAYVDKYLVTSLALFFSPPTSDDENRPTMVRGGNGP